MFESFQLFQGQRSPSLYFPSGSGASAKGPVYAGPPYSMAQRPATCPLLPPHVATPGLLTQQASRPKCISAVHHKRTQAQLHSKSAAGSLLLLLPILSATPARGWVVSCPHLVFVLLLPIRQFHSPSHPPNHGGNGSAASQPRGADGNAAPHPQLAAAVAAPARLPRLLLSVPPASAAAAAARGAGRARDEGGGGEDGRGDHREVRARVRPLESKRGTPRQAATPFRFQPPSEAHVS